MDISAENVKEYIHLHYMDSSLSLTSISADLKISIRWMTQIFRENYGITVTNYVNLFRIYKSEELLDSGMTVRQVSESVGFGNVRTFERVFKSLSGITPAEYRKQKLL